MARFRGSVSGQRGYASRLGSAKSGLHTEANGWNSGVSVQAFADEDVDVFEIRSTSGSNGGVAGFLIGYVFIRDGKLEFAPTWLERR